MIQAMANDNFIQQTEGRQKRIQSFAFVIAVSLGVLFSVGFAASGFWGVDKSCEIGLDEFINPNTAPVASLVRLPGIGIVRAEAIVAYRERFCEKNVSGPAFGCGGDLEKVRGIGPKTVQNISEWLKFE